MDSLGMATDMVTAVVGWREEGEVGARVESREKGSRSRSRVNVSSLCGLERAMVTIGCIAAPVVGWKQRKFVEVGFFDAFNYSQLR